MTPSKVTLTIRVRVRVKVRVEVMVRFKVRSFFNPNFDPNPNAIPYPDTNSNTKGKDVISLRYECYNEMAINCMRKICQKVCVCVFLSIFLFWLS